VNEQQAKSCMPLALFTAVLLCCWAAGGLAATDAKSSTSQSTLQQADQLQRQLSAEKSLTSAQIDRVNRSIPRDQQHLLGEIGSLLAADPNSKRAQQQWHSLIRKTGVQPAMDVNALVKWVMRDSYLQASSELQSYADKLKYFLEQKKTLRGEIRRVREHIQKFSSEGKMQSSPVVFVPDDRLSKAGLVPPGKPIATKASLAAYLEKLEKSLASTSDDEQLADVDLQNVLQKQQQTLQMLSNISKSLHDTAMATIRKIGD
jgi:hypothetical protein